MLNDHPAAEEEAAHLNANIHAGLVAGEVAACKDGNQCAGESHPRKQYHDGVKKSEGQQGPQEVLKRCQPYQKSREGFFFFTRKDYRA